MHFLRIVLFCVMFFSARSDIQLDLLETAKNPFRYLEEQNYTYENHTVTTEDGHNLLLVRIPYDRSEVPSNNSKPPLLFVHGILASFHDFLVSGPGISLGFKAVEEGYDVFFLNTRGNRWSRSHTTLDPDLDADEFWDFSWHEIGIYDLPATIDYITNITGYSKISYVAHSQGTTEFLAMASTRPEYNEKITIAVLLAPVSYVGHAQFIFLALFKNSVNFVEKVTEVIQLKEVLPYSRRISERLEVLCSPNSPAIALCREVYVTLGPSGQINNSLISAYFANFPAGASRRQMIHFLQNANTGQFRMYNYGAEENMVKYGQVVPPDYDLSAITAPVALYYGANDYFVALVDVARLAFNLPNVVRNVAVSLVQTNHWDVLIGRLAKQFITQPILNVINEYNNM